MATGERWLRGNGGCVLCSHPLPSGGCGEEDFHRLANGGYGRTVGVARKISTVWRAVATGERWVWRGRFPPSGERWLRGSGGCGEEDFHRLANGGYGGTVATGERGCGRDLLGVNELFEFGHEFFGEWADVSVCDGAVIDRDHRDDFCCAAGEEAFVGDEQIMSCEGMFEGWDAE